MVKPRPGGRTARTRAVVIEAAFALMMERGPADIGIAEIAERAGVATTSLYRRWGSVDALLLDVAIERLKVSKPLPDTGSIQQDLETWARAIANSLTNRGRSLIFRILAASAARSGASDAVRHRALEPRIAHIKEMLDRAKRRGEATPSIEEVLDYLMAPLYTRALFGIDIEENYAAKLAKKLMDDVQRNTVYGRKN